MSPSAFIPYCEFGGNTSAMGIEGVCNTFQARTLNDQICFEVDLDRFSNKNNIDMQLKLGFIFIMDYNEDRQVSYDEVDINFGNDRSFASNIVEADKDHAFIYLSTIGKAKTVTKIL